MNPSVGPKISRELLERMSKHNNSVQKLDSSGGPTISSHAVEKRGRKHVASYHKSLIGSRLAVDRLRGSSPGSSSQGMNTASVNNRIKPSFTPNIGINANKRFGPHL